MGLKEIRTAAKVDLNRPAADQEVLHVSYSFEPYKLDLSDVSLRTDGTPMVSVCPHKHTATRP